MQYSFAVAALIAGASAQYQVAPPPAAATTSSAVATTSATEAYPVETKSTAAVESSKSTPAATYPVESKTTEAVQSSKSTPAATYPVVVPSTNGTASVPAVKYTTEVVNQYTTFCPGPTTITHGTKTYTVTAPTTLTITDCPCTVSKPVYTTSAVVCNGASCSGKPAPPPTYNNGTVPAVPAQPTTLAPAPTGGYPTKPTQATTPGAPIPTAGAGKVAAFGGLMGLLAFVAI